MNSQCARTPKWTVNVPRCTQAHDKQNDQALSVTQRFTCSSDTHITSSLARDTSHCSSWYFSTRGRLRVDIPCIPTGIGSSAECVTDVKIVSKFLSDLNQLGGTEWPRRRESNALAGYTTEPSYQPPICDGEECVTAFKKCWNAFATLPYSLLTPSWPLQCARPTNLMVLIL